jgi:hypothetical protein
MWKKVIIDPYLHANQNSETYWERVKVSSINASSLSGVQERAHEQKVFLFGPRWAFEMTFGGRGWEIAALHMKINVGAPSYGIWQKKILCGTPYGGSEWRCSKQSFFSREAF